MNCARSWLLTCGKKNRTPRSRCFGPAAAGAPRRSRDGPPGQATRALKPCATFVRRHSQCRKPAIRGAMRRCCCSARAHKQACLHTKGAPRRVIGSARAAGCWIEWAPGRSGCLRPERPASSEPTLHGPTSLQPKDVVRLFRQTNQAMQRWRLTLFQRKHGHGQ